LVGTIDVVDVKHFPDRASPHASDTNSLERTAGLALDGADTYVVHAAGASSTDGRGEASRASVGDAADVGDGPFVLTVVRATTKARS
jgi:hypothetical protein